jgi:starch synthase
VLSLHNLAYQGHASGAWLARIGPRAEHFEWYGSTNALSGAIALADAVVAVSPTYAAEIMTPAGGFGLDGSLRNRWAAVGGILNGIDTAIWDPATDPALAARYSADDPAPVRADAKAANRSAIAHEIGRPEWADDDRALAVMVTRLTGQKGVDLVTSLVPVLDDVPLRLVVLGTGEAALAASLSEAATRHAESFAFVEAYDDRLAHLLFGGGDLYLMPSRFEPCGLAQMQAMRYGTIPVVTDVGGLHDTVLDADRQRNGTGFVAPEVTGAALTAALFRAARRLANRRQREALIGRAMKLDWSWRAPVRQYRDLYERLIAARRSP